MTASYSLSEAIAACEAQIALNDSADVDKLGRLILDRLNGDFRGWIALARDPRTPAGYFGENWKGPSLQSAITSSEHHRSTAEGLNQFNRRDAA